MLLALESHIVIVDVVLLAQHEFGGKRPLRIFVGLNELNHAFSELNLPQDPLKDVMVF